MKDLSIRLFLAVLAFTGCVNLASAEPLYQGSLGTTPDNQGWKYGTWPLTATPPRSASGGVTTLDTTSLIGDSAGYSTRQLFPLPDYVHPSLPPLDRDAGYDVLVDVQVQQETHTSDDRAGFSLLVLGDDLWGIELGFWEDQVWAQSGPDFTKAESAAIDTTDHLTQYELSILGNGYSLSADGNPLLTGSLRDYSSAAGGSNLLRAVYAWDNLIFLGDNTSSAAAEFDLSYVEVLAAVPEPSTALLLVSGGLLLIWRRSRARSSRP